MIFTYIHTYCLKNELNIVSDGEVTLENFCEYQQTVNPAGDDNPLHYDYAILITGYVMLQLYNLAMYIYVRSYVYALRDR